MFQPRRHLCQVWAVLGVFVQVADGIEGLVHPRDLAVTSVEAPDDDVQVGDDVTAVATQVDREGRRLSLALRTAGLPDFRCPRLVKGMALFSTRGTYAVTTLANVTILRANTRTRVGPI
ncbi:S1 RNA-binding domain-containing protein [Streptomyces sp. NBC_00029]|uniref:S1 RNA-binding domain-containing protein n=1 Tax=Streptomyces sp. NBC_00029 TaxID=2903613 RepID=UPI00324C3B10